MSRNAASGSGKYDAEPSLSLVDAGKSVTSLQKTKRLDKRRSSLLSSWYIHNQSTKGIHSFVGDND